MAVLKVTVETTSRTIATSICDAHRELGFSAEGLCTHLPDSGEESFLVSLLAAESADAAVLLKRVQVWLESRGYSDASAKEYDWAAERKRAEALLNQPVEFDKAVAALVSAARAAVASFAVRVCGLHSLTLWVWRADNRERSLQLRFGKTATLAVC